MPTDQIAALIAAIRTHAKTEKFSGVVQLIRAGDVLLTESLGYANRAEAIANTAETRFGVASGSKILTAAAICRLVLQGKLRFDSRLVELLSIEFPKFDHGVTIDHLLSHTSGIPDYFDEEELDAAGDYAATWRERPMYNMLRPVDYLPMFQNQAMKFPPGERFAYNNAGFVLLGMVVETISGQRFQDFVAEQVLAPAGMDRSGYFFLDQLPEGCANGYIDDQERGNWRTNFYAIPIVGGGDGGAFLTAKDVAAFWDALLSGRLLGEEITQKMLTPQVNVSEDGVYRFGRGVWIKMAGEKVVRYYIVGEDPGVTFFSAYYPAQQTILTLLSNGERGTWTLVDVLEAALFQPPESP